MKEHQSVDGNGHCMAQRWTDSHRSCWMGRQWISSCSEQININQQQHHPQYHNPHHPMASPVGIDGSRSSAGFRLISYNVLSDFKNAYQSHSTVKNWDTRRQLLLAELVSYSADVICLQDADHYQDWWRPQLTSRGKYYHRSYLCLWNVTCMQLACINICSHYCIAHESICICCGRL